MFQQFYKDTLGSRFIKSLLAQIPIPNFDCIFDGNNAANNTYYVYKNNIVKCQDKGTVGTTVKTGDKLTCLAEGLTCNRNLFCGTGYKPATLSVIKPSFVFDIKTHSTYKSLTNYYDPETHYHLGRYLRYLKSTTGINLMPYYNCYNSTYFSDIFVSDENKQLTIKRTTDNSNYKVIGVPILFGHEYTIAVDSIKPVIIGACLHDADSWVPVKSIAPSLEFVFNSSFTKYSRLSFHKPITFRIDSIDPATCAVKKFLYLLIQLPKDNDSSLVVIEDYDTSFGVQCNKDSVREVPPARSKLLAMNTHESFAFSDRLVEYLLDNVISKKTIIPKNITNIHKVLKKLNPDYKYEDGQQNDDMFRLIYDLVEQSEDPFMKLDQDGYINRDVEKLIYEKGVNY